METMSECKRKHSEKPKTDYAGDARSLRNRNSSLEHSHEPLFSQPFAFLRVNLFQSRHQLAAQIQTGLCNSFRSHALRLAQGSCRVDIFCAGNLAEVIRHFVV